MSAAPSRARNLLDAVRALIDTAVAKQVIRGGVGGLAIKAASVLLGILLVWVLARSLGAEGYGVYAFAFALLSFLAVPAQLGLPSLVIRETARAQAKGEWQLMRGIWSWSGKMALFSSLILAALGIIVAASLTSHLGEEARAALYWGVLLVPLIALGNLRGAALRGLRKVVLGQLPEFLVRPLVFLVLLLVFWWWAPFDDQLTASRAMSLHVIAASIAFAIGAWLLWRARPPGYIQSSGAELRSREWRASLIPFGVISAMQLGNRYADILLLGYFADASDVGVYRVVVQAVGLVAFGFQAAIMVMGPHFARLHAMGDMEKLQQVVTVSSWIIFLSALPIACIYVAAGDRILGFVFGVEYTKGYLALSILAIGRLLANAMGPVSILLGMSGYERLTALTVSAGAGANLLLLALLVPIWGLNGAALASAVALVSWHLVLWRLAIRKIGINTLPILPRNLTSSR